MKGKLHTAEHILYEILLKRFNVESKATEFKENSCRVDYVCLEDLRKYKEEIEKEVNCEIKKDYEMISYSLPREKAAEVVDLRLVNPYFEEITVYELKGFGKLACGGPHVKHTTEIGVFKIFKIEKKGKDKYSIVFGVD